MSAGPCGLVAHACGLATADEHARLYDALARLRADVEALRTALAHLSEAAYEHAPVVRIHQASARGTYPGDPPTR